MKNEEEELGTPFPTAQRDPTNFTHPTHFHFYSTSFFTHKIPLPSSPKNQGVRRVRAGIRRQDCVPKLRFCVDSIRAFDERLRAQDPSDRTRKGCALGGGVCGSGCRKAQES